MCHSDNSKTAQHCQEIEETLYITNYTTWLPYTPRKTSTLIRHNVLNPWPDAPKHCALMAKTLHKQGKGESTPLGWRWLILTGSNIEPIICIAGLKKWSDVSYQALSLSLSVSLAFSLSLSLSLSPSHTHTHSKKGTNNTPSSQSPRDCTMLTYMQGTHFELTYKGLLNVFVLSVCLSVCHSL